MPRFLIAGCQRSGTTMLAAALARHPSITVFDESDSYSLLVSPATLPMLEAGWVGFKIPRWTDLLPGPLAGEPDQELNGAFLYGGEPILHIVRDPSDVVLSMDRLVLGSSSWLDQYGIPLLKWRLERDELLRNTLGRTIEGYSESDRRWAYAAGYWHVKNDSLLDRIAAGWTIVPLLYGEVARNPEAQLRRVVAALGLTWSEEMLRPVAALDRAAGGTDPGRVIDTRSLGRGRENLAQGPLNVVDAVAGPLYREIVERLSSLD